MKNYLNKCSNKNSLCPICKYTLQYRFYNVLYLMYSYYSILAKVPGVACGNFERIFFLIFEEEKNVNFFSLCKPPGTHGYHKKNVAYSVQPFGQLKLTYQYIYIHTNLYTYQSFKLCRFWYIQVNSHFFKWSPSCKGLAKN